jgi:thiol-disulfide isomerase/thioredoxin
LLLCGVAPDQDESTAAVIARLKEDQQTLRAELNSTRAELANLRKLIAELAERLPQGTAPGVVPQDQAPALSQINEKLDRILRDLNTLKNSETRTETPKRPSAADFVGKQAPKLSLVTTAGVPVSNEEFTSYPVTVLNFVAPNCGYCARQIPKVEQVRAEYEAAGVRFVNISETMRKTYTTEEAVNVYTELGSQLEVAIDKDNAVGKLFNATGYPTMYVINDKGKVEHVTIGAKANIDEILGAQLEALLTER